jgi:hypothetical protein
VRKTNDFLSAPNFQVTHGGRGTQDIHGCILYNVCAASRRTTSGRDKEEAHTVKPLWYKHHNVTT